MTLLESILIIIAFISFIGALMDTDETGKE